jgi:hypothetical protein
MAKFRCNLTGNVFEFVNDFDINDMREHPQYTEIQDGVPIKDRNYSAASDSTSVQEKEQDSKEKVKRTRKVKEV